MAPQIEKVVEGCVLGEAPHWDSENQTLYFVDIIGNAILRYVPATKKVTRASVAPDQPSFIVPVDSKKNQFIVSLTNELAIISWDGESESVTKVDSLCSAVDYATPPQENKFNDAKCDSSGRLWAGTHVVTIDDLPRTQPLGVLYTFDSTRQLKVRLDKIRIANGLAFNEQAKKFYYIDSLSGTLDQFDFDISSGTISNRQVLFTLSNFDIPGMFDGMTIDTDGNLWVAVFGGGKVLKIDGKKPETLLDAIEMPAVQVTSLVFGGKNLDELYVTTGAFEALGHKMSPSVDGATYKITNTGSKAPQQPTFIIPVEEIIISLDNELAIVCWDGDSDKVALVEKLFTAHDSPTAPNNKFNDGKCDSSGRLWVGTYGDSTDQSVEKIPATGCLYSFDFKRQLQKHEEKIRISNGLTFNEQAKKMFYIDSMKRTVDQFDFDITTGTLTNRKVFFTFEKFNIPGFPDGMTIDTDGNLWVASFSGKRILKIYGQEPEILLDSIEMPALQVTSMTFGGPNLDELYVTTGCIDFEGHTPSAPVNGATYKVTGIGSKDFPCAKFKMIQS